MIFRRKETGSEMTIFFLESVFDKRTEGIPTMEEKRGMGSMESQEAGEGVKGTKKFGKYCTKCRVAK